MARHLEFLIFPWVCCRRVLEEDSRRSREEGVVVASVDFLVSVVGKRLLR